MDEEAVASDNIVTEFSTYEDFLDSQITPLDLYYLEVMLNHDLDFYGNFDVIQRALVGWKKFMLLARQTETDGRSLKENV